MRERERRQRFDPDERFSLHPEEGEDVLRHLLHPDEPPGEDDPGEDGDAS